MNHLEFVFYFAVLDVLSLHDTVSLMRMKCIKSDFPRKAVLELVFSTLLGLTPSELLLKSSTLEPTLSFSLHFC